MVTLRSSTQRRRASRRSRGKSRRTSGSPPVRRTSVTPIAASSADEPLDLLEVQDVVALEPRQPLGGHAVLAAEVAAVGDRHAQIADPAAVPVEKRVHRHAPSVSCRAMRLHGPARRAARSRSPRAAAAGAPSARTPTASATRLSAFAQASAKHDYRRVCADLLAKPVIDSVRRAGLTCENAMKTALEGVEAPEARGPPGHDQGQPRQRQGPHHRRQPAGLRRHGRAGQGGRGLEDRGAGRGLGCPSSSAVASGAARRLLPHRGSGERRRSADAWPLRVRRRCPPRSSSAVRVGFATPPAAARGGGRFWRTHASQRSTTPSRPISEVLRMTRFASHDPRARGRRPAPRTAGRSFPLDAAVSARGAADAWARPQPGAAARSVATKSVLAIGPTHGDVAPASG